MKWSIVLISVLAIYTFLLPDDVLSRSSSRSSSRRIGSSSSSRRKTSKGSRLPSPRHKPVKKPTTGNYPRQPSHPKPGQNLPYPAKPSHPKPGHNLPYPAQPSHPQPGQNLPYPAQPSHPQPSQNLPYPAQPSHPQPGQNLPYPAQPSHPQPGQNLPYPAQPSHPQPGQNLPYPAQPSHPQPGVGAPNYNYPNGYTPTKSEKDKKDKKKEKKKKKKKTLKYKLKKKVKKALKTTGKVLLVASPFLLYHGSKSRKLNKYPQYYEDYIYINSTRLPGNFSVNGNTPGTQLLWMPMNDTWLNCLFVEEYSDTTYIPLVSTDDMSEERYCQHRFTQDTNLNSEFHVASYFNNGTNVVGRNDYDFGLCCTHSGSTHFHLSILLLIVSQILHFLV